MPMAKRRKLRLRASALALAALLAASWVPCFACQGHDGGPGFATRSVCHVTGNTAAASCGTGIRMAGTALRIVAPPVTAPAVAAAPAPAVALAAPSVPPRSSGPLGSSPISRPPLYLLHGSLLA